jgi:hypothetical protein
MLEKNPAERIRLITIMDMEYYKMEDSQVEKLMEETRIAHEAKMTEKEEAKKAKANVNNKFEFLNVSGQPPSGKEKESASPSRAKKVVKKARKDSPPKTSYGQAAKPKRRENSANKSKRI